LGNLPALECRAMLVFTRTINEQIIINETIVVTVVEVRGDKARLGIEAPIEVPVHRGEVHAAIRRRSEVPDVNAPGTDPRS